jgi:hypothetical protein
MRVLCFALSVLVTASVAVADLKKISREGDYDTYSFDYESSNPIKFRVTYRYDAWNVSDYYGISGLRVNLKRIESDEINTEFQEFKIKASLEKSLIFRLKPPKVSIPKSKDFDDMFTIDPIDSRVRGKLLVPYQLQLEVIP